MGRNGYVAVAVLAGAAVTGVIVLSTAAIETDAGAVLALTTSSPPRYSSSVS